MKNIYRKIETGETDVFHLQIPESYAERLHGLKKYQWFSNQFALLFSSPCLLHSFGMKNNITLQTLARDFRKSGEGQLMPTNSIAISLKRNLWIAEMAAVHSEAISNHKQSPSHLLIISPKNVVSKARTFLFSIRIFLVFFATLLSSVALAIAKSPSIRMQVGESKEVMLDAAPQSLDLSQPDIIDVQRIGMSNKILVTALKSGAAQLTVRYPLGTTRQWFFNIGTLASPLDSSPSLSSASLLRLAREIQKRTGLEAVLDNGRVVIFGFLQTELQVRNLLDLCFGRDECLPRFSIHEDAGRQLKKIIQEHLDHMGFHGITLEQTGAGFILKGSIAKADANLELKNLIGSVVPRVSLSLDADHSSQPLIETQLSFFRVTQTGLTALGLSTQAPENQPADSDLVRLRVAPHLAKLRGGPQLGFIFPELALKALTQNGILQQIARPSVVTASGSRGEILSGGELIFQTKGQVQKFLTQNYGISIVVKPKLVDAQRISHLIELKITHPQADPTQNAISAMSASVLNTEINCKPDETLLLTRINQRTNGKTTTKIPILGHIPLLGELFKSRELQDEDAELWITLKSQLQLSQAPSLPDISQPENPPNPKAHLLD